jgi:peptidoglycan/LPS O-acetylase OafA/YrhL
LSVAAVFATLSTISGIAKKALGLANDPNPFTALHMTYVVGLACHFIAGVIAGAIGGVMRPLSRWLLGAMLIGGVAGVITVVVFSIGEYGRQFWNPDTKWLTVGFACIGAIIAPYARYKSRAGRRPGLGSRK